MTDTPAGKPSGYDVVTGDSGHRALGLIQGQRFEVALVDVVMPGMDGLTLVDRLMAEHANFQIIFLTGNPRLSDVRQGLKEGVFDYLTKPQKVEDPVTVIRCARKRRGELEEEGRKADIDRIMRERPEWADMASAPRRRPVSSRPASHGRATGGVTIRDLSCLAGGVLSSGWGKGYPSTARRGARTYVLEGFWHD